MVFDLKLMRAPEMVGPTSLPDTHRLNLMTNESTNITKNYEKVLCKMFFITKNKKKTAKIAAYTTFIIIT